MDSASWLDLCYEALGIPPGLSDQERRRAAESTLLETTNQPVDILGIGAADAAIDLVVRYGVEGRLDEVLLRWEQAEQLSPEISSLGDEGTRRATVCAKKLLREVVAWAEQDPRSQKVTTRDAVEGPPAGCQHTPGRGGPKPVSPNQPPARPAHL